MRLNIAIGLFVVTLFCYCTSCGGTFASRKVHEVTKKLPGFPEINIADSDRFLNDLKLSPLWKVEKERDGTFIARSRSINPGSPFDETGRIFLFELMEMKKKALPKDYRIRNRYLDGQNTFSSFTVKVVFQNPNSSEVTIGESGKNVTLGVYESFDKKIGPNSSSQLAIKLSGQHEIYILLREQGSDSSRSTTFAKLPLVLRELKDISASPAEYRIEERYNAFFQLFFQFPLKNQELKRFPGIQDRDTFYGYFRAKPKTSYEGLNIKVSHPIYCPDEGTRKSSRLRKAEYLGTPYHENDILFFLIEDNAIYLSGKYDNQFGTFTGTGSFEGNLEILNANGIVLLKTTEKFKGWQR
ncbi:hypothetical protein JYU16_01450 [bacterium AH-315-M05]|nr:hypothetical protein [bacterium AH-315-M05]